MFDKNASLFSAAKGQEYKTPDSFFPFYRFRKVCVKRHFAKRFNNNKEIRNNGIAGKGDSRRPGNGVVNSISAHIGRGVLSFIAGRGRNCSGEVILRLYLAVS